MAAPPAWLVKLLRPEPIKAPPRETRSATAQFLSGPSIADQYSANTSWAAILMPHGWSCPKPRPRCGRRRLAAPTHTSTCSATIKHGKLFVYSSNTPFGITEAGNPRGYTKFRAYAVLDQGGDMSAAARALLTGKAAA